MTALTLQDAVSQLITQARTDRSVLRVAHEAVTRAKEYSGDSRQIAVLTTEAGFQARLNMELTLPPSAVRPARPPRSGL